MRLPDFRREAVLGKSTFDAGNQVIAIRLVIDMLELAASAFREMTAWRLLMMRARLQRAVVG